MWYTGSDWDELEHIRQAIGFLVSIFFTRYHLAYIRNVERRNGKMMETEIRNNLLNG